MPGVLPAGRCLCLLCIWERMLQRFEAFLQDIAQQHGENADENNHDFPIIQNLNGLNIPNVYANLMAQFMANNPPFAGLNPPPEINIAAGLVPEYGGNHAGVGNNELSDEEMEDGLVVAEELAANLGEVMANAQENPQNHAQNNAQNNAQNDPNAAPAANIQGSNNGAPQNGHDENDDDDNDNDEDDEDEDEDDDDDPDPDQVLLEEAVLMAILVRRVLFGDQDDQLGAIFFHTIFGGLPHIPPNGT